ncbi:MAG: type I pullulanase [Oscillospiraceae bacterium]|nr:type I pullulanase [Oscillospiraceae bacterium]
MFEKIDEKYAYSGNDLGAVYTKEETSFKVWAPLAANAAVRLYHSCRHEKPFKELVMTKEAGVWAQTVQGDLDGVYYTYVITYDGIEQEVIDIYAKSAGANGAMGLIFDPAALNPENWENQTSPPLQKYTDACIYELHVRDFSIDQDARFVNKGKFAAFTEKGLVNTAGDKIGIDHLKELGITHVQLLPVYDFHTVDETDPKPQFNWGYDPMNFNCLEGSYSSDPFDGKTRVREFKLLVQALHNEGIGVIMDVVYNHTYSTADSGFNLTFPKYYYRQWEGDSFANGSGCGNEVATERAMVRKYIIDSLTHWMTEYKLDGFRFDLMGLYDINTLREINRVLREINPQVMLYGEGWTGADSPLPYEMRAMKLNARNTPAYAYFSDDFRDTVKGNNFINKEKGYVNGAEGREHFIKEVMSGRVPHPQLQSLHKYAWTDHPYQTINYVEVHDNLTLWNKLYYSNIVDSEATRIRMHKLAGAIVFLSQGIPLLHAAQDFLRSKPLPGGAVFDHNSYKSPDAVNSIKWDRKAKYKAVFEYYKGLIEFRKAHSALRMSENAEVAEHLHYFDALPKGVVGFSLTGDDSLEEIIVFLNNGINPVGLHAFGEYSVYIDAQNAGNTPLYNIEGDYSLAPISAMVLGRKREEKPEVSEAESVEVCETSADDAPSDMENPVAENQLNPTVYPPNM